MTAGTDTTALAERLANLRKAEDTLAANTQKANRLYLDATQMKKDLEGSDLQSHATIAETHAWRVFTGLLCKLQLARNDVDAAQAAYIEAASK